jgi:hypothetical protein
MVEVHGSLKVRDIGVTLSVGITTTLSQREIVGTFVSIKVVTMTFVGITVEVADTFPCKDEAYQFLLAVLQDR